MKAIKPDEGNIFLGTLCSINADGPMVAANKRGPLLNSENNLIAFDLL
jgi:hypothetical protein